jgi:hypothetical protein
MLLLKDYLGIQTRHFTVAVAFTLFTIIYFINLIGDKMQIITFPKISRFTVVAITILLFVCISGPITPKAGLNGVQYIWDKNARIEKINDPEVVHYKNGPYFFKQMADYLTSRYPNSVFNTLNANLSFYLKRPEVLKYSFSTPNPAINELHYQEVNNKISDSTINLLVINLPITNLDELFSIRIIRDQLVSIYGENSEYGISQTILDEFQPIFAVNQNLTMHVLLARGLNT